MISSRGSSRNAKQAWSLFFLLALGVTCLSHADSSTDKIDLKAFGKRRVNLPKAMYGYGFASGTVSSEMEAVAKLNRFCTTQEEKRDLTPQEQADLQKKLQGQLFDYIASNLAIEDPKADPLPLPDCLRGEKEMFRRYRSIHKAVKCTGASPLSQSPCKEPPTEEMSDRLVSLNFPGNFYSSLRVMIDRIESIKNIGKCQSETVSHVCSEKFETLRLIKLSAPMFFDFDPKLDFSSATVEKEIQNSIALCKEELKSNSLAPTLENGASSRFSFLRFCFFSVSPNLIAKPTAQQQKIVQQQASLAEKFGALTQIHRKKLSSDLQSICSKDATYISKKYPQVVAQLIADSNEKKLKKYSHVICDETPELVGENACEGVTVKFENNLTKEVNVTRETRQQGFGSDVNFQATWDKLKNVVHINAPVYFIKDPDVDSKTAQNFLEKQQKELSAALAKWSKSAFCPRFTDKFRKGRNCGRVQITTRFLLLDPAKVQLKDYSPVVRIHKCWNSTTKKADCSNPSWEDSGNWTLGQDLSVTAHEFTHLLGANDEYWEAGSYERSLSGDDKSLMFDRGNPEERKLLLYHFENMIEPVKWCENTEATKIAPPTTQNKTGSSANGLR